MPKGDNYIRHYVWVRHIGKQWGSGSNTVGEHLQGRSFSNNDTQFGYKQIFWKESDEASLSAVML